MRFLSLAGGFVLSLAVLFSPAPATAQVDVFEFDTAEQEERFRQLSNEFRCPMCQNANLTSSTGGVAADLRREIHRMIMEGQTDAQIEEFMLSRYGDFVLYNPRLTGKTILLWFGPLLFLIVGGWVTYSIIRRSAGKGDLALAEADVKTPSKDNGAEKTVEISAAERERLNRLLAGINTDSDADKS